MRGDDEDEDVLTSKDPQVTSEDPEERKAARRLRIKRRQGAIKKKQDQMKEIKVAVPEEEMTVVEQATTKAAEVINQMILDGNMAVTNVRVITDEREVNRRNANANRLKAILDQVEAEAADAALEYEVISENWHKMMELRDPLEIDEEVKAQKVRCDELLAKKTLLIDKLKADLKVIDIAYYDDLEKQDTDIKDLSDRIEKQLAMLQKMFEMQLHLIEEALNFERTEIVDYNNKRWEALYKQRDRQEEKHIELKEQQLEEHKQRMEKVMWDHHEQHREAKIELETLCQELQKELEKLKSMCLINSEKIGYAYQVLKKREEENIFVRSQQKRKLNKMTDVANELRAKIRAAAEASVVEEIRGEQEITKLMGYMASLEAKSYQFSKSNDYRFQQVWRMAQHECHDMLKEFRQIEMALYAHVLAETPPPWHVKTPPNPLIQKGVELAQERLAAITDPEFSDTKEKLVQHILQLVSDNTGFLVEDRLLKLIEKHHNISKNICTLDAIFMALEIQDQDDIDLLAEVFLSYAFCPVCVALEDQDTNAAVSDSGETKSSRAAASIRARANIVLARSMSTSTTARSVHVGFRADDLGEEDQLLMQEAEDIVEHYGDCQDAPAIVSGGGTSEGGATARRSNQRGVTVTTVSEHSDQTKANPFVCADGHPLEIEPMQVLSALGEFVTKFVSPDKKKLHDILESVKPPNFDTPSRRLTLQEIEDYWTHWKSVFPEEKDRLWDGVIKGLQDYFNALSERDQIHGDVSQLRKKNSALRQLVRGALPPLVPEARSRWSPVDPAAPAAAAAAAAGDSEDSRDGVRDTHFTGDRTHRRPGFKLPTI